MTDVDSQVRFWVALSEWGFVAVIVGVLGEGVELVQEWRAKFQRTSGVKPSGYLLPFETFFFVLLVLGLAAEFWGSHKAVRLSELQNAYLNNEAAQARKEAAEAVRQASSNEVARVAIEWRLGQ